MKSIGQRARPPPTALPRPFPICSRPLAPLCPAPHLPSVSSRRQHSRLLPCPRRLLDIAPPHPHPHPRLHPSPHPLHQPPPQPIPAARCAAHPPLLAAPTWSLLMPCAMRSPRGPPTINQIPQNQGRWGKKPSHRVLPHHPPTSTAHRPPNADARKPILRTGSASLGHLRRLRSPLSSLSGRCLPRPAAMRLPLLPPVHRPPEYLRAATAPAAALAARCPPREAGAVQAGSCDAPRHAASPLVER